MRTRITLLLGALALGVTAPLSAQVTPTPENTEITNTVTVNYKDANGNSYSANAEVKVTVGFLGGVTVTSPATVAPVSPSTNNNISFTLTNAGNGSDNFFVTGLVVAGGPGVTNLRYVFDSVEYADDTAGRAALNTALAAAAATAAGGTATIVVRYDLSVPGGEQRTVTLNARSVRDATKTGSSTTLIAPPPAGTVQLTADQTAVTRLPNITASPGYYSTSFVLVNNTNSERTFNLTTNSPADITGLTITGTGVTTTGGVTSITLDAGTQGNIEVRYNVAVNTAPGEVRTVTLTAVSSLEASVNASANHVITVIRPQITIIKDVFRADQATAITASDRVLPGEDIWYRLTVTNSNAASSAAAVDLVLTDNLPLQVLYASHSVNAPFSVTSASQNFAATATTLAPGASSVIWIRVTVR
jgi:hypothetical protein